MADNFDMKRFLFENKLGSYARNTVVENQYEGDQYDDEDEDEDEDYDLNAAFTASPASHSYDEVLDIFVSYEDEDILNKFKSSFPKGKDITKDDFVKFSKSTIDDMSEMGYVKANWISLTDDDVYEKAGLIENQKEGYMGTQYGSSEDMAVDMVKKGIKEITHYQLGDRWSPNFDYKGMLKAAADLSVSSSEESMQNISDSFEDVNYHRENDHLQDAIEAKKENDNDAIKYHLALFKDELKKTIKNLKETQIFERKKVEEGETLSPKVEKKYNMVVSALKKAKTDNDIYKIHSTIQLLPNTVSKLIYDKLQKAGLVDKVNGGWEYNIDSLDEGEAAYEYEKGKAAGKKEEKAKLTKEDIGGDIGDATAAKMMDFLAEKDKVKEGLPIEDPRVEKIIQTLKDLDVDGETMEYILKSVGMDDQMANQLVHNKAELDEVLSGETLGKMDKSADQLALADFRDNAYYVISSLREDGFDDKDILEFLQQNLTIAFR